MRNIAHRIFLNTLIEEIVYRVDKTLFSNSIYVRNQSLCFYWVDWINVDQRLCAITKINPTFWGICWPNSTLRLTICLLVWKFSVLNIHRERSKRLSTSWVKHDSCWPLADFCKIAWRVGHLILFGRFLFNTIVNTLRLKLLDYPDHIFGKGTLKSIEDISFPYSSGKSKHRKWRK